MNWKLILLLSMFGLAMGLATVFVIPPKIEPLFWLVILVICAYTIGRQTRKPFLHGFLLGLANCVWITSSHILLFNQYLATHTQEAAMMQTMPFSPRIMMAIVGLFIGLISGVVIGILALLARKLVKPAGG
jgi:capsular polysaccharide biosynthesis protein